MTLNNDVTVIVCTRDRPEMLARTLPSVVASAAVVGASVLVVEQGDSKASTTGLPITVVRDPGSGASRARNIGIALATELILFTDDDCEAAPGWVAALSERIRDANVAMVLGPVVGLSNGIDIAPHLRRARPWLLGHSANMAIRRSVALRIGGFDQTLGAGVWTRGGEDADLIVRMLDAGERVETDVGPEIRHVDWRNEEASSSLRLSYERGAGAWIGRAIRREGRGARRYATARAHFLRERAGEIWDTTHSPAQVAAPFAQFAVGCCCSMLRRSRNEIPPVEAVAQFVVARP